MDPTEQLNTISQSTGHPVNSVEFARYMDDQDPLHHLRDEFHIPQQDGHDVYYMCGNSLGLMPRRVTDYVQQELDVWRSMGVEGHFDHAYNRPWADIDSLPLAPMAKIVGARVDEVAVMGTLTSNLHHLLSAFYHPTGERTKILVEDYTFPSDNYALSSHIQSHGLDPLEHLIKVKAKEGEYTISTEDIVQVIQERGDEIAVVLFGGVHYLTGQLFDMKAIAEAGHAKGCFVGFDLAHGVGNVPLYLHDWNVDFACWGSYKYLNAGPGGIAGLFVHSDVGKDPRVTRLAGWWGHNRKTRFDMPPTFDPQPGAASFQLSNPSVLNVVSLMASLEVFGMTDMETLRAKSVLLTAYLELLLHQLLPKSILIATPKDYRQRGCHLAIFLLDAQEGDLERMHSKITAGGVICDHRKPNYLRLAPVPLYNTFMDVYKTASVVAQAHN
jgi:kynureninase